jgi:hypothetical protein
MGRASHRKREARLTGREANAPAPITVASESRHNGFLFLYRKKRKSIVWTWSIFNALVLACWITHALPFTVGKAAITTGHILGRSCGGNGFAYSYNYEVNHRLYEGVSRWGGIDGNGPCERLLPGAPVAVTYRTDEPGESLGGTVRGWNKALDFYLAFGIPAFLVALPLLEYIRERRKTARINQ